jgi:hypothetical protein
LRVNRLAFRRSQEDRAHGKVLPPLVESIDVVYQDEEVPKVLFFLACINPASLQAQPVPEVAQVPLDRRPAADRTVRPLAGLAGRLPRPARSSTQSVPIGPQRGSPRRPAEAHLPAEE